MSTTEELLAALRVVYSQFALECDLAPEQREAIESVRRALAAWNRRAMEGEAAPEGVGGETRRERAERLVAELDAAGIKTLGDIARLQEAQSAGPASGVPEYHWLGAPDIDNEHDVWFDASEGGTKYVRADLAAAPPPSGVVEAEIDDKWRELALQFDGHRIAALSLLRAVVQGHDVSSEIATFLAAPPLPAEQVLADRLAALAAPQAPAPGWMSMDSAPKDGTWFLGWENRRAIEDTIRVWHWDSTAGEQRAGMWIDAADSCIFEQPTHWMPLPASPQTNGEV